MLNKSILFSVKKSGELSGLNYRNMISFRSAYKCVICTLLQYRFPFFFFSIHAGIFKIVFQIFFYADNKGVLLTQYYYVQRLRYYYCCWLKQIYSRDELHWNRFRSSISADDIYLHSNNTGDGRHVSRFRQPIRRRHIPVVFTIDTDRIRRNVFRYRIILPTIKIQYFQHFFFNRQTVRMTNIQNKYQLLMRKIRICRRIFGFRSFKYDTFIEITDFGFGNPDF